MNFLDILFSGASIVFLVSQYFQSHVDLHRCDFIKSSKLNYSSFEQKIFAASHVNFLSDKTVYYPRSLQEAFSLIVKLGQINCLIFLVYYGYKTAWYSTGILFFGSIFLSIALYALVKSKPAPRKFITILAFVVVPASNLAIWFLL